MRKILRKFVHVYDYKHTLCGELETIITLKSVCAHILVSMNMEKEIV